MVGLAGTVSPLASLEVGMDVYDRDLVHHVALTRDAVRRWLADLHGTIANTLVSGAGDMESAESGLGLWRLAVAARDRPAVAEAIRAGAGDGEFFDPTLHAPALRRIADETGGKYYTPATAGTLAEDVRYAGRGVTALEIDGDRIRLVYWFKEKQGRRFVSTRNHEPEQLGSSGFYRIVLNEDHLDYVFSRIHLLA